MKFSGFRTAISMVTCLIFLTTHVNYACADKTRPFAAET